MDKLTSLTDYGIEGNQIELTGAAPAALAARLETRTPDGRAPGEHADARMAVFDHIRLGARDWHPSWLAGLRELYPATPVVVLVLSEKRDHAIDEIDSSPADPVLAPWLRGVVSGPQGLTLSGATYFPALVEDDKAAPAPRSSGSERGKLNPRDLGLTVRQAQVLALIIQGKPNKLICRELRIAEGTVKCHVSALLRALNVATRTQAVLKATRIGLELDSALSEFGEE